MASLGKIGRWFVGLFLGVVAIGMLIVGWKVHRAREFGRNQAAGLTLLKQNLAERGVKLCLAFAPYRSRSDFRNNAEPYGLRTRLLRSSVIKGIVDSGIPVFDLYEPYHSIANQDRAFIDSFHVSAEGASELGQGLKPKLEAFLDQSGKVDSKILIMGECYAVDLATGLQRHWRNPSRIDALRAYDDPLRVVDLLFRFADVHLADTDIVIWFMPDDMLWRDLSDYRIPEVHARDERILSVRAKVMSDAGFDFRTWDQVKARLTYPNALAELKLSVEQEEPGLPKEIIVVNYCVKDRQMTGFEGIKKGDTLVLKLQDLDSYFAQNRKTAADAYLTRVDDYFCPRFWIMDWTKTAYGPASAGRGGI